LTTAPRAPSPKPLLGAAESPQDSRTKRRPINSTHAATAAMRFTHSTVRSILRTARLSASRSHLHSAIAADTYLPSWLNSYAFRCGMGSGLRRGRTSRIKSGADAFGSMPGADVDPIHMS
jgi:hypothetical protein